MRDKIYALFSFISEYALYGLLFFIPISISLVEIFAALMFIGFVGRKILKPDFRFLEFWPNLFLLLFLLFNIFSMLNSGNHFNISLHALFGKWIKYIGICFIIQDNTYDRKMINRGMLVFLFSAALVVISGLSQYFFGIEFLRHKSTTIMSDKVTRAMTSSFDHYNGFAGYLVVVLSLIITMLLENSSLVLRTVSLFIFLIFSGAAIMFTFSRGSWLALAVSFIFSFVLSRKKIQWLIPVFLTVIAISFFPGIRERLHLTFRFGGDADRFKIWAASLKMINDHPFFGMGAGTFMANFSKYLPGKPLYAHNCYLQIWAETGVFSLISFLGFVVSIITPGVKKFIYSKDFLLLGLLAGFIGFLVRSFFDANLYSLQLAFLFWVWAGLIIAAYREA